MILYGGFGGAVVTINPHLRIAKLRRHGLTFDFAFQMPELNIHIDHAPTTYRTSVRGVHVFIVTPLVNAVPATHEDNCSRGIEHVLSAYRAVAFR